MRARFAGPVLAFLLAAAPAAGGSRAAETEWSLARLMAAMAGVREAQASFVEERHLQYLTEPLIIEGTLSYMPGRLEKRILKPEEERLIVQGDRLRIVSPAAGRRTVLLSDYPVLEASILGLRATLDGDLETLKRFYWVEYEVKGRDWRLDLTPRATEVRDRIRWVRLSGTGSRIVAMEIVEAGGDRSLIRIREN